MRNETAIKVAKQISMKQRYSRVIFFFLNLVFFLLENITIKTIEISWKESNQFLLA